MKTISKDSEVISSFTLDEIIYVLGNDDKETIKLINYIYDTVGISLLISISSIGLKGKMIYKLFYLCDKNMDKFIITLQMISYKLFLEKDVFYNLSLDKPIEFIDNYKHDEDYYIYEIIKENDVNPVIKSFNERIKIKRSIDGKNNNN